jgi:Stress responsive A/B Barrel Domain
MTTEAESSKAAIAHSVTMTCKEGVGPAQVEDSCSFLKRVGTSVPGLVELVFGRDLGRLPMAADFLHIAVFDSRASLEEFEKGDFQRELMTRFGPTMIASATIAEIAI